MQPLFDPKRFPVLKDVPEDLIKALGEIATVKHYDRGELVFQKGDPATAVFFMLAGKGLFQAEARPDMTVYLGAVRPGYLFGWSAVFPGQPHHHTVVCAEASEIAEISTKDLQMILNSNQRAGFVFLRNILQLAMERLELRTDQLLKLFETNPQLQKPE